MELFISLILVIEQYNISIIQNKLKIRISLSVNFKNIFNKYIIKMKTIKNNTIISILKNINKNINLFTIIVFIYYVQIV